jgi:hypothetical protein
MSVGEPLNLESGPISVGQAIESQSPVSNGQPSHPLEPTRRTRLAYALRMNAIGLMVLIAVAALLFATLRPNRIRVLA